MLESILYGTGSLLCFIGFVVHALYLKYYKKQDTTIPNLLFLVGAILFIFPAINSFTYYSTENLLTSIVKVNWDITPSILNGSNIIYHEKNENGRIVIRGNSPKGFYQIYSFNDKDKLYAYMLSIPMETEVIANRYLEILHGLDPAGLGFYKDVWDEQVMYLYVAGEMIVTLTKIRKDRENENSRAEFFNRLNSAERMWSSGSVFDFVVW